MEHVHIENEHASTLPLPWRTLHVRNHRPVYLEMQQLPFVWFGPDWIKQEIYHIKVIGLHLLREMVFALHEKAEIGFARFFPVASGSVKLCKGKWLPY